MTPAVVSGLLLGLAVVAWPTGERAARVSAVLSAAPPPVCAPGPGADGGGSPVGGTPSARVVDTVRELWRADPVQLFRQWRQRRHHSAAVTSGVLALLEGIAPALEAGLPPAVAVRLSGAALGTGIDPATQRLVAMLADACEQGGPIAPVWRAWAVQTGSPDLAFVAAAWQLTELTGAPLADAVQRAVVSLREARERTRRVHVAVAGPKATVVVLTVLPLTGPAFGLACGVPPAELYVSSPISTAAAAVGLVLIWAGRLWCRRLVESATRAGGHDASPPGRLA